MSRLERRENPAEKVHILDLNTLFMWVRKKLEGDVRMGPAVPEQRRVGELIKKNSSKKQQNSSMILD